jgi:hypothetical protein
MHYLTVANLSENATALLPGEAACAEGGNGGGIHRGKDRRRAYASYRF